MDFSFSEEQEILRSSARAFLENECPKKLVRELERSETGHSEDLWKKMAELGWLGIVIPEEYGGFGGDFLDLVVLLEEMGRACVPSPFFSTIMMGAIPILEWGSEEQRRKYLPGIVLGDAIWTMAHYESGMRVYDPYLIELKAEKRGKEFILNGCKAFVPYAHIADYMICVARTKNYINSKNGITIVIIDNSNLNIKKTKLRTISGEKYFHVYFENVSVSEEMVLGQVDRGGGILERVHKMAAIAKCAEMVGGGEFVLEMVRDYVKERKQFDRQIGSFQAVQHHCANMIISMEGARYITYKAAWKLKEGLPCDLEVAAAKAWVSDACKRVVSLGHQLLGGIGFMEEHDMPLYTRRAKASEVLFGDSQYHRKEISRLLGLLKESEY